MKSFTDYRMELRPRSELSTGLVLYGEAEPAEMQFENLWKIVDLKTGEELVEPGFDLSEFPTGDILSPSMREPKIQAGWAQKQREYESAKDQYSRIKRMCHARFIRENSDLPLAQDLAGTDYGRESRDETGPVRADFVQFYHQLQEKYQIQHSYVQAGTGYKIHDGLARDGIEIDHDKSIRRTSFCMPGVDDSYTKLATACDETGA